MVRPNYEDRRSSHSATSYNQARRSESRDGRRGNQARGEESRDGRRGNQARGEENRDGRRGNQARGEESRDGRRGNHRNGNRFTENTETRRKRDVRDKTPPFEHFPDPQKYFKYKQYPVSRRNLESPTNTSVGRVQDLPPDYQRPYRPYGDPPIEFFPDPSKYSRLKKPPAFNHAELVPPAPLPSFFIPPTLDFTTAPMQMWPLDASAYPLFHPDFTVAPMQMWPMPAAPAYPLFHEVLPPVLPYPLFQPALNQILPTFSTLAAPAQDEVQNPGGNTGFFEVEQLGSAHTT